LALPEFKPGNRPACNLVIILTARTKLFPQLTFQPLSLYHTWLHMRSNITVCLPIELLYRKLLLLDSRLYRVSQEEYSRLREGVPYVKVYRYNPKHLCPKLNGYGDNGARKVWSTCGSTYCTWFA